MKLSLAIMLGSTTCKMEPGNWNSCAIGAAANAIGIPQIAQGRMTAERFYPIEQAWPWLDDRLQETGLGRNWWTITSLFDGEVCNGMMTLEQLADHVRKMEPDCETCCRFTCTCAKSEAVPESVEAVCQL